MYAVMVIALLFVLPLVSTAIEVMLGATDVVGVAGKWLVVWAVGVRLFLAGVKQVTQPGYTAETFFALADHSAHGIVREVGFGNLSFGTLGLLSLLVPGWTVPAALAGGLYYLFAGLGHAIRNERNSHEQMAMVTDLVVGALLLAFVANRMP